MKMWYKKYTNCNSGTTFVTCAAQVLPVLERVDKIYTVFHKNDRYLIAHNFGKFN